MPRGAGVLEVLKGWLKVSFLGENTKVSCRRGGALKMLCLGALK